jgi:DNA polymerase III subunit beta
MEQNKKGEQMKLEIDRTKLVNALALASKAVADKGVKPVLANVYLKAANDKLQLVGTDGEQMMIVEVSASIDREGAAMIPAKLMLELCSALPSNSLFPVAIEHEPNDYKLMISLDKSRYEIITASAEDYVPVPALESLEMAEIKGSILALAMKQASIAAAGKDEVNPVQKSVYVDLTESPTVAATDSKRLMVVDLHEFEAPANMKQGLIVPGKAVKELSEMFKHADIAKIAMFKDQLVCRVDNVTYLTRLVEGRYPAYQRVLPKESTSSVIVSRRELSQALKSLLPIARNNSNAVSYEFAGDSLSLIANSPENGKAETKIDCKITGEPPKIGLNLQFVNDFLGCVDCDSVKMELTTASYPVLFSANDNDQRYVVMPLSF